MKKICLFIFCFLSAFSFSFSMNELHIEGKISKAIVFQSGAEISMPLKIKLEKGPNRVYIDSMFHDIDQTSIRISAKGKAGLMSYLYRWVPQPQNVIEQPKEVAILEDSLEEISYQIAELQDRNSTLKDEANLIKSYNLSASTEKGSKVQDLTSLASYYNKRLNEIGRETLANARKIAKLEKIKGKLNINLILTKQPPTKPVSNMQIVALMNCEAKGTYDVWLSFFVSKAGWTPYYDIRADDLNKPAQLIYKANVWQTSGKDWNDVQLVFSTRNPSFSASMPVLSPWYLRYAPVTEIITNQSAGVSSNGSGFNIRGSRSSDTQIRVNGYDIVNGSNLSIGMMENKSMSVEFSPSITYTIPSDGQMQNVTLNEVEMESEFEYFTTPKADRDAFLAAKINNWGEYRLLAGEASVFFENSYIGKTNIDPSKASDTLVLSLGRDKSIVVNRESIEDFTETKFLSDRVEKSFGYKIKVLNNKKAKAKITIEDQIPVSTHESIEVKLLESTGAKLDPDTGKLTWVVTLEPGKTAEKKFSFKVIAPKNVSLNR